MSPVRKKQVRFFFGPKTNGRRIRNKKKRLPDETDHADMRHPCIRCKLTFVSQYTLKRASTNCPRQSSKLSLQNLRISRLTSRSMRGPTATIDRFIALIATHRSKFGQVSRDINVRVLIQITRYVRAIQYYVFLDSFRGFFVVVGWFHGFREFPPPSCRKRAAAIDRVVLTLSLAVLLCTCVNTWFICTLGVPTFVSCACSLTMCCLRSGLSVSASC